MAKRTSKAKTKPKAAPKKTKAKARAAKRTSKTATRKSAGAREVLAWLEKTGTKATRDGMARYAIPSDKAYGVPVGVMRAYAKKLGRSHELAAALWTTDRYEARMLATFLDHPAEVTPAQMDQWCEDFDNWAICDTACFHLFDRTPHAFAKVKAWAGRREEFVKRAAFALLASLSVHDKRATDDAFIDGLRLIERAATDERNFVKKSVNWALRSIGKRNRRLNGEAIQVSRRLASAESPAARWVGKDALRELSSQGVMKRLSRKT